MNHTILVEDFISPSSSFFSFSALPNTFLASREIKISFFFLVEESIYEAIVSTHSYWILAI
jgi:hypothetical protein